MERLIVFLLIVGSTHGLMTAAEKDVYGEITYVTSGTVYVTVGRDAGIQDSTVLYAVSGKDTIAVLRVFALSSASSACRVISSTRDVAVGTRVVATIHATEPAAPPAGAAGTVSGTGLTAFSEPRSPREAGKGEELFDISGRISSQFLGVFQNESQYNVTQPGLVTKLNVRSNDVPVAFDLYANFRNSTYGTDGIFSDHARNQSRIHRLAVDYDDGKYKVSLGRFAPSYVASIGYIDGLLFSTSTGSFSVGAVGGFQPAPTQRAVSTDYKKFAFFTNYFPDGNTANRITLAYARTYYLSELDREAATVSASFALSSSFTFYAHSDFNLRKKEGETFTFSPQLSQIFLNARYRLIPAIGLGLGGDATRPLYPYSTLRTLPPEFVDTELRGGVSFSVYLYLPEGISFSNSYTPRTSRGSFADNYTEYAALTVPNIASSGFTIRTNFNMSANDYTDAKGYGVHLFRNMWRLFDITVRYQEYNSVVRQLNQTTKSSTIGADLLIPFSRTFSLMGTFEQLESPGIRTNTVFAEMTVRF